MLLFDAWAVRSTALLDRRDRAAPTTVHEVWVSSPARSDHSWRGSVPVASWMLVTSQGAIHRMPARVKCTVSM